MLCEAVWERANTNRFRGAPLRNSSRIYRRAYETLAAAKAEVLANYDDILVTLKQSFAELAEKLAKWLDATV